MMNVSRPLVTPEELQCLLGWPLDEVQDPRPPQAEYTAQPAWAAAALVPAGTVPAAAFFHGA